MVHKQLFLHITSKIQHWKAKIKLHGHKIKCYGHLEPWITSSAWKSLLRASSLFLRSEKSECGRLFFRGCLALTRQVCTYISELSHSYHWKMILLSLHKHTDRKKLSVYCYGAYFYFNIFSHTHILNLYNTLKWSKNATSSLKKIWPNDKVNIPWAKAGISMVA